MVAGSRRASLRLAGLLATVITLSLLWLVAAVVPSAAFPPALVAEAVVRAAPGGVATFFIDLLQHWALRLLIAAVLGVALAVGAEAMSLLARDGRPRPYGAGLLLALVAAAGLVVDPTGRARPLPYLAAVAFAALVYGWAAARVHEALVADAPEADASRRRALRLAVGGVLGVAASGAVAGFLARRLAGPDTNVELVAPTARAQIPDREPFPDIPGLTSEITSAADHYVVDINLIEPSVEAEGWSLRVFGEVEQPLRLGFAELQSRFEVVEEFSVLTCVSNEIGGNLVGTSAWGGVRLRDVLDEARVKAGGRELVLRAADGYSDSFPVDLALDPDVLLAVSQNGAPLTQEHGFPCRVRIPRLYGMENVKWLESIEVVSSDYRGYWQRRGWKDVAVVKTQSRIDVAGDAFTASAGTPVWIAGIAWAGTRGIERVEVSTDDGATWADAMLKDALAPNAWRLWAYRWTPPDAGSFAVLCRAADGEGNLQTPAPAEPHPDGASGYHRVEVRVA